jgi:hypothetical protein
MGGMDLPRTPNLPSEMGLDDLIKMKAIPARQGVILKGVLRENQINYKEIWKLSNELNVEYAITKENGKFVLRSGAPNSVRTPPNVEPIAHTHPLTPDGESDNLPSRGDITTLNIIWREAPDGPRPSSKIIWGPGPDDFTEYNATGFDPVPPGRKLR